MGLFFFFISRKKNNLAAAEIINETLFMAAAHLCTLRGEIDAGAAEGELEWLSHTEAPRMELTVLGHREPPFLLVKHPPLSLTTSESLVHAGKRKKKTERTDKPSCCASLPLHTSPHSGCESTKARWSNFWQAGPVNMLPANTVYLPLCTSVW